MPTLPETPSCSRLSAVQLAAQCRDLAAWLQRDDVRWSRNDKRTMVASAIALLTEAASRIAPDECRPDSPEFLIVRGAASVSQAYREKYEEDAQASRVLWVHRAASRVLGANGEYWLRGVENGRSRAQIASASAEGFAKVLQELERICKELSIRPLPKGQA